MRAAAHPDRVTADGLKKFWGRIADDWVDPSSIDHWAPSRAGDPELHD
jgi:hypothetical protein